MTYKGKELEDFLKLNKVCEFCGKPLVRRYYPKSNTFETINNFKKRLFCNRTCKLRAKALVKKKNIEPRICECCGKEFIPSKNDIRIKFCSTECYLQQRKETNYMKEYGEKNKEKLSAYNKRDERKEKKNKDRRERYKNDAEYRERTKAKVAEYNKNNPQMKLNQHLQKYGLTVEQYNEMLIKQDKKCAICGESGDENKPHRPLYVDHNHETGRVRGLLCQRCNFMIGQARDSIEILRKGIRYLENYEM